MSKSNPTNEPTVYPLDILEPTKQLDEVLICLIARKPPAARAAMIFEDLFRKGITATESDIIQILNKLALDGFASKVVKIYDMQGMSRHPIEIAEYSVTFEGRMVIQYEGGYSGRLTEQNENETRIQKLEYEQMAIQRRTLTLTVIAGSIGFLVFVVSLLDFLLNVKKSYPFFPCCFCH